jgi:citrate lyase subunit beta/citryl-CoA lyase
MKLLKPLLPAGLAKAFLFVPANRPERFMKALDTGAHIIVDLEDAVSVSEKAKARECITQNLLPLFPEFGSRIVIRMNNLNTNEAALDLELIKTLPLQTLIHPKTENTQQLDHISTFLKADSYIVPMVESAQGIDQLRNIAAHPKTLRLTLGNIDLQADLGFLCDASESELQPLRFQMTVLSRLFDLAPPIDGVTTDLHSEEQLLANLKRARGIGFLGKLCLHPKQIATTLQFYRPSDEEISNAQKIVAAFESVKGGAVQLDGKMIDRPVFLLAQRLLQSVQ